MIVVDRARRTFQGGLFSLHAHVYRLSTLGGPPCRCRHRPPPHPLPLVGPLTHSSRGRRHLLRLSSSGFSWSSVGPRWIPGACESREGLGLQSNGCWGSHRGREGVCIDGGREGMMMWQFVIMYEHVCKRAGHAGTRKIIKKKYSIINTASFYTTLVSF